jgi:hypothetical protein
MLSCTSCVPDRIYNRLLDHNDVRWARKDQFAESTFDHPDSVAWADRAPGTREWTSWAQYPTSGRQEHPPKSRGPDAPQDGLSAARAALCPGLATWPMRAGSKGTKLAACHMGAPGRTGTTSAATSDEPTPIEPRKPRLSRTIKNTT